MKKVLCFGLLAYLIFSITGLVSAQIRKINILVVTPVMEESGNITFEQRLAEFVYNACTKAIMRFDSEQAQNNKIFLKIVKKARPTNIYRRTLIKFFYKKLKKRGKNFLSRVSSKRKVRYILYSRIFLLNNRSNKTGGSYKVDVRLYDSETDTIYNCSVNIDLSSSANERESFSRLEGHIYNLLVRVL